jgi:hypothetical protein
MGQSNSRYRAIDPMSGEAVPVNSILDNTEMESIPDENDL